MNKILIVDGSPSDSRDIINLLMKAGYVPVCEGSIEARKKEATKLPPGAVIIAAMRLPESTAVDFIDWLKIRGKENPVIVLLDASNAMEIYQVMKNHGAVDVVHMRHWIRCLSKLS